MGWKVFGSRPFGFLATLTLALAWTESVTAQLSTAEQSCVNEMNKNLAKVGKALGKDIGKCIRDGAKDKLGVLSAEDCLTADRQQKVTEAKDNTIARYAERCAGPQPLLTDATSVNQGAMLEEFGLFQDIYGSQLDDVLIKEVDDKNASKCQQAVSKRVQKCADVKVKEFNTELRSGMRAGTIVDESSLATAGLGRLRLDPQQKIAKCTDILVGNVEKKCVGNSVDLAVAFPGCETPDPVALVGCLDSRIDCRVCLGLAQANGFDPAECDVFDDDQLNSTCLSFPDELAFLDAELAALATDLNLLCQTVNDADFGPEAPASGLVARTISAAHLQIDWGIVHTVDFSDILNTPFFTSAEDQSASRAEIIQRLASLNNNDIWIYNGHGGYNRGAVVALSALNGPNYEWISLAQINTAITSDGDPPGMVFLDGCGLAAFNNTFIAAGTKVSVGWNISVSNAGDAAHLATREYWQRLYQGYTLQEAADGAKTRYMTANPLLPDLRQNKKRAQKGLNLAMKVGYQIQAAQGFYAVACDNLATVENGQLITQPSNLTSSTFYEVFGIPR